MGSCGLAHSLLRCPFRMRVMSYQDLPMAAETMIDDSETQHDMETELDSDSSA